MNLTIEQVGQLVKKKYTGAYDNNSDFEVGKAFVEKNPDYSGLLKQDQTTRLVTLTTKSTEATPTEDKSSVVEFGKGVAKGIGSTVISTAELGGKLLDQTAGRLANIIEGKGNKAGDTAEFIKDYAGDTYKPTNTAQKAGFAVEQVAEFFIPQTYVAKAAKVAQATKLASNLMKVEKSGGLVGKLAGFGRVGFTHGLPEAVSTAVVSTAQGQNIEDVSLNSAIAGAIPVVGKGISMTWKGISPSLKAARTGVPANVWVSIKEAPEAYETALKHIVENPQQPYFALANTVAGRLKKSMENASKYYTTATEELAEQLSGKTFNVSPNIDNIAQNLKSKFNITLTPKGIQKTAQSPYSDKEVAVLNDLIESIAQSKNIQVKDVIDLNRKISRAYDAMPLAADGKTLPIHAVIEDLSQQFDNIANKAIPELAPINKQYAAVRQIYSKYAPQLLDESGNLKQGAEQFLSNLSNINKGAARKNIAKLEEVTGLPIVQNTEILKDAQKLNNVFPATGGRTLDVLRSLGIKGLAAGSAITGGVGGAVAGGLGIAATSPLVTGKIAIKSAKALQKFEALPDKVKNIIQLLTGEDLSTISSKIKP